MEKRKRIIVLISSIILVILVILTIILAIIKKKEKTPIEENGKLKLVMTLDVKETRDAKEFRNINYCVNDFFTALANQNKEKVLALLDKKYKLNKNINISNVMESVSVLSSNCTL